MAYSALFEKIYYNKLLSEIVEEVENIKQILRLKENNNSALAVARNFVYILIGKRRRNIDIWSDESLRDSIQVLMERWKGYNGKFDFLYSSNSSEEDRVPTVWMDEFIKEIKKELPGDCLPERAIADNRFSMIRQLLAGETRTGENAPAQLLTSNR